MNRLKVLGLFHSRSLRAFVALFIFGIAQPAVAGQPEIDMLLSYVGNWKGTGMLQGTDSDETFSCRMSVAKGNQAKINYAGRCTLVSLNLSVSGTIVYDDDARHYLAAMTSNAAFSGKAIGRRRGDSIVFDLKERDKDEKGNDLTIGSTIILKDGQITVNFDVMFNESGHTMKTSVPFSR